MSQPRYAAGYDLLSMQLGDHLKYYTPKGWRGPLRDFMAIPGLLPDEARDLMTHFKDGDLDDYLVQRQQIKHDTFSYSRFFAEAAKQFFESDFYKNAVGFDTEASKQYPDLDALKRDINRLNSQTLRLDNKISGFTREGDYYPLEEYPGLSLVAQIGKMGADKLDLRVHNQILYDLAGRPLKPIPEDAKVFSNVTLTQTNTPSYQLEVLPF